jgi:hypothetical protein
MNIEVWSDFKVVRINAPEWFTRADFAEMVRQYASPSPDNGRRIATWHTGAAMNEYSDVFVVYDGGELSDPLPDDLADAVSAALARLSIQNAILWISNLSE